MGLTRSQILRRVELPLALPAISAGHPHRGRHDDQPRDGGRVHHAVRARQADLRRPADQLPHRVRRRRAARDRARARGRRRARRRAARLDAVGAEEGDGVIARRRLQPAARSRTRSGFSGTTAACCATKALEQLRAVGDRDRDRRSRSRCRSASGSATSIAARSSRSTSRTSAARCRASRSSPSGCRLFGIGHTVVILALVVLAAPLILTNSYVAVDGIDADVVEAARGMGLTPWQVLVARRAAARAAAHLRGHSHGRGLRRRDRDAGGRRRRRLARRHHLQPGDVLPLRRRGRGDSRVAARVRGRFHVRGTAAVAHAARPALRRSAQQPEQEPPSVLEAAAA